MTVVSTSTRNFPNRLGNGANVYLASAELASVAAILGKLPTPAEYQTYAKDIDSSRAEIFRYMNFDQMPAYNDEAEKVEVSDSFASDKATEAERLRAVA